MDSLTDSKWDLDQRLDLIQRENFYEYEQVRIIYKKFVVLMKQPRNKSKIKGILLTGRPDAGKSTLIRQFPSTYALNVKGGIESDIRIFEIPPDQPSKSVFASLCRKLTIPDIPGNISKYNTDVFVKKAASKLHQDCRLLIMDEFQNLFLLSNENRRRIIANFNQLINESRIPIVLVGVDGVDNILKNIPDDFSNLKGTFGSRFPQYKVKKWEDGLEFVSILLGIYEDCYFHPPKNIEPFYKNKRIRNMILELTDGLLGRIIELIKTTAINILLRGLPEIITEQQLEDAAQELGWSNVE